jgi:Signal transduction histidine kinase
MDSADKPTKLLIPFVGGYADLEGLSGAFDDDVSARCVSSIDSLVTFLEANPAVWVPVLIVNGDKADAAGVLAQARDSQRLASSPAVVLTSNKECDSISDAVDNGQLSAVVPLPTTTQELRSVIGSVSRRWMIDRGIEPLLPAPEQGSVFAAEHNLGTIFSSDEDELTEQLVRAVDEALGPLPRLKVPSGTRLTRQGEQMDGIFIVVSGRVALTRETHSKEMLMHHRSTGRVIGLLSMVGADSSYFTSTTTTEAEVILIGMEVLRSALLRSPQAMAALTATAILGLSQRLVRSEELQVDRDELNAKLQREQKRLRTALRKLKKARLELVFQTKFAMLGELSAGIAHELNNPVAALIPAAEHISEDIDTIMASHPAQALLSEGALEGANHGAMSTAEERAIRREIENIIGDPEMAFRLVSAGITDPTIVNSVTEKELELIEAAANIGTASRNIRTASARIAELVSSLRAYARPENQNPQETDVCRTIDDTLSLLSHRMHDIEITKNYEPIPMIQARPSELGQVWTNLLVNAADVLEKGGEIEINVTSPEGEWVQVEIIDNGPGIAPENFAKIFDPQFTTKQGTIRYGLGRGLGLTRQLVEHHGGAISVDSVPGRTVFSVGLPLEVPMQEEK